MEVFVFVHVYVHPHICIYIYIYVSFLPRKQIKLLRAGKKYLLVPESMKVSSSQCVVSFQHSKNNF